MLADDWKEAQEAIDRQITAHKHAILELCTHRNDKAPISQLPIELLEEVFVLAKLLAPPRDPYNRFDDRGWLNVAHVCRNWREIVFNAPRIWNKFDVGKIRHLDWAVASIARSQLLPLHVKCTDSEGESQYLAIILMHMDRVEHLEISSNASRNPTGLSRIIDMIGIQSASSLQSLHLYNRVPEYNRGGIQQVFGAIQMPCLRTLDIRFFTLPPAIPTLTQLRQFSYTPPLDATAKLPIATMLSLLRNMPSLQRLEVGRHTLQTPDRAIAGVELPKLSFISSTIKEFEGMSLFQFIQYPPSARVKFLVQGIPTRIHASQCLTPIVTHMANGDATLNIDTMILKAYNDEYFSMSTCARGEMLLEVHVPTMAEDILPFFRLSLMLPRSIAHTLEIVGFPSLKEADWLSLFRRHVEVQKLMIWEVNTAFVQALSKTEAAQPPFPKLKSICLWSCDVGQTIALFKRILEERLDCGCAIDLIEIHRCRVTKDMIVQLEAYVRVQWDGEEGYDDDDDNDDHGDGDDDDDNDDHGDGDDDDDDDDEEEEEEDYYNDNYSVTSSISDL